MATQNRDVTVGEGILPADHKASLPSNASMAFKEVFGAHSPTSYHIQNSAHKLDSPHKDDSNASTSHTHVHANQHKTCSFAESFVPCSVSSKNQIQNLRKKSCTTAPLFILNTPPSSS
ncbi:hypothetical protein LguiA_002049 [Lonicera macranthoides]